MTPILRVRLRATWKGQSQKSRAKQQHADQTDGRLGVLAYYEVGLDPNEHVTGRLVPEVFEGGTALRAEIAAKVLRARLPDVVDQAREREPELFEGSDMGPCEIAEAIEHTEEDFTAFVKFCETKQRSTKAPVTIELCTYALESP